jgi:D-xylose transport system permease protein
MSDTSAEPRDETTPPADDTVAAIAADLQDERLIQAEGSAAVLRQFVSRLRGGDLGNLPVVAGLVIICAVFYGLEPRFLSSFTLVSITQFAAPVGIISLGIVLVLLLGEIDLSVGSVSGFAAAILAIVVVRESQSFIIGLLAGIGAGVAVGLLYSLLYVKVGVPSFVFSLAGLIAFEGGLLYVLGDDGTLNLPTDSWFIQFARFEFLPDAVAYVLVVAISALYLFSQLYGRARRVKAGLSPSWLPLIIVKTVVMVGGLAFLTYYLGIDRGWSYLWLVFVALVVVMDLALRKTTWGRHLFAVGGNEEAARRSGIKVGLIYTSVFVLCSTLAALGGLLGAALQTSVSQATGTGDTNLTAIAAAVIGGTSLFGGRGSAYSALFGILVLQAIARGLNLVGVESDVRFMITGGVLLLAVAIDSVSRKARAASGRG